MIAKVIAHAPTRREAAMRLARALEATRIQGITHNRDYLVSILRSPEFVAGDTTTDFIGRVALAARRSPTQKALDDAAVAAALHARAMRRASAPVLATIPGGFRNSVMPPERAGYRIDDRDCQVTYRSLRDGSFDVRVDDRAHRVIVYGADGDGIDLALDGCRSLYRVTRSGSRQLLHGPDGDIELTELSRFPEGARAGFRGGLQAPMPGRVLALFVAQGEAVTRGQALLVLEAMKMEHRITAPADGTVRALRVAAGDQVANGALLIELEETKES